MKVTPDPVAPGQESVWDYPRPAVCEPTSRHIRVIHRGHVIADTQAAMRTLETSHAPSYYVPPADVDRNCLRASEHRTFCEWKGQAQYFDVVVDDQVLHNAAWRYHDPTPPFAALRDYIAFYADPFDACLVDGEQATPQPGHFYAGWITSHVAGPFKGGPGTRFW
jgi:uncharacterized protein (DUF427 family)